MITGTFSLDAERPRPVVDLDTRIPSENDDVLRVRFLIDTGADYTLLSPRDAIRLRVDLGVDLLSLPIGITIGGIGGEIATRRIEATVAIGNYIWEGEVLIAESPPGRFLEIPSLLGWDVMRDVSLFMDYASGRVWLLEPGESIAMLAD